LSHSIGRQNHLSLQIGSELDQQHELLEDVDGAMDRTAARLGGARKRLDQVARDAKQYGQSQSPCICIARLIETGSTITIVALIIILLLLIIVFKT
jgi:syntaxin 8